MSVSFNGKTSRMGDEFTTLVIFVQLGLLLMHLEDVLKFSLGELVSISILQDCLVVTALSEILTILF